MVSVRACKRLPRIVHVRRGRQRPRAQSDGSATSSVNAPNSATLRQPSRAARPTTERLERASATAPGCRLATAAATRSAPATTAQARTSPPRCTEGLLLSPPDKSPRIAKDQKPQIKNEPTTSLG